MAVIIDRNVNNEIIENLEKLNIMYYDEHQIVIKLGSD